MISLSVRFVVYQKQYNMRSEPNIKTQLENIIPKEELIDFE